MTLKISSSTRDVAGLVREFYPDLAPDQIAAVTTAIWQRPDFPHPIGNTDIGPWWDENVDDAWILALVEEPRYTIAELLSVADAAAQLGIKERRMQVLIREHGLGRRIGRDYVLTPADVERMRNRPGAGRPPLAR